MAVYGYVRVSSVSQAREGYLEVCTELNRDYSVTSKLLSKLPPLFKSKQFYEISSCRLSSSMCKLVLSGPK